MAKILNRAEFYFDAITTLNDAARAFMSIPPNNCDCATCEIERLMAMPVPCYPVSPVLIELLEAEWRSRAAVASWPIPDYKLHDPTQRRVGKDPALAADYQAPAQNFSDAIKGFYEHIALALSARAENYVRRAPRPGISPPVVNKTSTSGSNVNETSMDDATARAAKVGALMVGHLESCALVTDARARECDCGFPARVAAPIENTYDDAADAAGHKPSCERYKNSYTQQDCSCKPDHYLEGWGRPGIVAYRISMDPDGTITRRPISNAEMFVDVGDTPIPAAHLAKMQAVIDAAIQWRKGSISSYPTSQALRTAVDAYLGRK